MGKGVKLTSAGYVLHERGRGIGVWGVEGRNVVYDIICSRACGIIRSRRAFDLGNS